MQSEKKAKESHTFRDIVNVLQRLSRRLEGGKALESYHLSKLPQILDRLLHFLRLGANILRELDRKDCIAGGRFEEQVCDHGGGGRPATSAITPSSSFSTAPTDFFC